MNYPDTATSLIGRPAPSFVAHSTKGMLNLEAFEGSWVLLFLSSGRFYTRLHHRIYIARKA